MASGFMQRFKGKIQADSLWVGRNGVGDSYSGVRGLTDFMLKVPLTVTAVATTDFTISLPAGGTLMSAQAYTTTQFGAATNANLTLGSTIGGNDFVTAVDIKTVGLRNLTLISGAAALLGILAAAPNVFARITQVGTASATGTAFLLLNYTAQ